MITASIVLYHHRPVEIQKVMDCILPEPVDILYLVDNSLDDRLRALEGISNKVRYIHSANRGYGAGHNIAIREASDRESKYHIVVNPDIYFEKDSIPRLKTYMDTHPQVGLVMPKILYPDGDMQYLCKLLPTPWNLIGRRFIPWKNLLEISNRQYELRFADYNKEMSVPSLSGCFMFLRMEVIRQTGGFDERFFMYTEDVDLCRRIGRISQTMYFPEVCVYHAYAKSSYKNKRLLRYHIYSAIKYFNKWGWLWDKERKKINRELLSEMRYNQLQENFNK